MKKQILKNLFVNYLTSILAIVVGFLLVPFIIKKLGTEAFGLIILGESTIAFFEVIAVNIRMALARYVTFSLNQKKKEEFQEYLSTGQLLFFVSAIVVFLIGCVISYYFPQIFRIPPQHMVQSKFFFLSITCAFSLSVIFMVSWAILYAKHRFDLISCSSSVGIVLRGSLLYALFSILPENYVSLGTYGLIYLTMVVVQNACIYVFHKKVFPEVETHFRQFKLSKAKEILSFSSYLSLNRASSLINQNANHILINIFWGATSNTIFSLGTKLPSIMSRFFEEATWTLTSTFNELVAKNDREKIKFFYYFYTKIMVIIITPPCFILTFLAQPLIEFWVGPDFALSGKFMSIFMVPLFFEIPLCISGCLINSYGKIKIPCFLSLGVAIFSLILGIILGKVFSLGLWGIVISAVTCISLYRAFFSPTYSCLVSNISIGDYFWKAFIFPFLWSSTMSVASFYAIKSLIFAGSYSMPLFLAWTLLVLYLIGTYNWVLNPAQKREIKLILNLHEKGEVIL